MPQGKLFSTDDFSGGDCETITPKNVIDILSDLKSNYKHQIDAFKAGKIKSELNEYSDYKCFMI